MAMLTCVCVCCSTSNPPALPAVTVSTKVLSGSAIRSARLVTTRRSPTIKSTPARHKRPHACYDKQRLPVQTPYDKNITSITRANKCGAIMVTRLQARKWEEEELCWGHRGCLGSV